MKTDFHNKDFALSLDLKWRLKWTRKWPITCLLPLNIIKISLAKYRQFLLRWKDLPIHTYLLLVFPVLKSVLQSALEVFFSPFRLFHELLSHSQISAYKKTQDKEKQLCHWWYHLEYYHVKAKDEIWSIMNSKPHSYPALHYRQKCMKRKKCDIYNDPFT